MDNSKVDVQISKAEAIVLFELLSRFSDTDKLTIENKAEEIALWNLEATLEKILPEPFLQNYQEILEASQKHIVNTG